MPHLAALAVLAALALALAVLVGVNIGQRRASARIADAVTDPPLFAPIPAPWWAMPHIETECQNAQCRVHYPYANCMGVVGDEWCRLGRDHKGDCEADLTSYYRKGAR